MKVYVNDECIDTADASNISLLLKQLNTTPKGIAVAIGANIIPSNLWDDYQLKEDDQVLLIRATQGG
ncbi:sulfur carrier protein ThiS [Ancylomarina euxinus]|uniref:Sulfur carrier protein ThiS n=1 Tax=Ancylomarina euxinus TaxID=2283627 RepID=A0A425XX29_9BACT|nr:sulfur carrier protein ThiS [Ancylomarina euxinus]MCZ4696223.1 sulfur carrier protein ThiS [Ancylomarina euxinus]MUP16598.1 sulfur carrier protein ThiS [Ancylomarina euxinus]RRG19202.1 sulfur carrier protein ThiS [Ancylomarina euxinus]